MPSITVNWRDINASNIPIQYRIYRDTSPIDTAGVLPAPIVEGLPKSQLSYVDSTVTFGTTYYYVVSAYTDTNEVFGDEQIIPLKENRYATDGNDTLIKIGFNSENQIPSYSKQLTGGTIMDVDCDADGFVYTISSTELHKIDQYGDIVWTATLPVGNAGYSVIADSQGNVYAGLYDMIIKYDSTGTNIQEILSIGGRVYDLCIDYQGFILALHTTGDTDGDALLKRIDSASWTVQWDIIITNAFRMRAQSCSVDPSMNIYVVYSQWDSSPFVGMRKVDASGNITQTIDYSTYEYTSSANRVCCYDPINDRIFALGGGYNSYIFDSALTQISSSNNGSNQFGGIVSDGRGNSIINRGLSSAIQVVDSNNSRTFYQTYNGVAGGIMSVEPGRYAIENGLYTPT